MGKHRVVLSVTVGLALLLGCVAVWCFYPVVQMIENHPPNRNGIDFCAGLSPALYNDCATKAAETFRTVDYAEGRDLAKSFLTIVIAVFVASVTFSEKIVDLKAAPRSSVIAMLACWLLLLLSIVSCGTGLLLDFYAMYGAIHYLKDPFGWHFKAGILISLAGVLFAAALVCLFFAGLPSLFPRLSSASAHPSEADSDGGGI